MSKHSPTAPGDSPGAVVTARATAVPVLRSSLTPGGEATGDGIPIGDYLAALRRYAWLVAGSALLAVGVAGYRVTREPTRYIATTSMRLVERNLGMSGDLAGAGGQQATGSGWSYIDPLRSQIQILRSRAVAGMAAESLGLRLQPLDRTFPYASLIHLAVDPAAPDGDTLRIEFNRHGLHASAGGQEVQAPYGAPIHLAGVTLQFREQPRGWSRADFHLIGADEAAAAVQNAVQAHPREATDVLDVGYTALDPTLARRGADAVAHAFQVFNAQSARQEARLRRIYIEQQLRTTDSLLVKAQYELSSFRQQVQAFSPREKFRAAEEDLGALRLRREEVAGEQMLFDQMLANLRGAGGRAASEEVAALAASPQIASNGGIVRIYEQLVRYQTSRDSITTGPWSRAGTNPDVIRLDSLIATYRARLERAVEARAISLRAQVRVMDEVMAGNAAALRGLPDAEAEEVRLSRQVETLQTLADDLLREQQKARIDEAVKQGAVEVVDRAGLGFPLGRGTGRRLSFALLVGLLLGTAGALTLDRLNNTVRRREDVENLLHVPILAVVPRVGDRPARRRFALPSRAAMRQPSEGTELIVANDMHSSGSQSYRKLRTHLIFAHPGAPLRTLLVTSPAASEGKSTVSANLAVAYAQQRLRVALVDADLRRSRLHTIFGRDRIPGLAEVVAGQATLDEALQETGTEGLHLLAAGTLVPNVSELLGTDSMARVLRDLSERFDLVIVDTPPVLAAADAEILGVQTDAVLLVVRAGQTDRSSAQYAVQQMRAVGARIVGAVLNDPDEKIPGYGRYGYYYEEYYAAK